MFVIIGSKRVAGWSGIFNKTTEYKDLQAMKRCNQTRLYFLSTVYDSRKLKKKYN